MKHNKSKLEVEYAAVELQLLTNQELYDLRLPMTNVWRATKGVQSLSAYRSRLEKHYCTVVVPEWKRRGLTQPSYRLFKRLGLIK
jgi:hypothetical protein